MTNDASLLGSGFHINILFESVSFILGFRAASTTEGLVRKGQLGQLNYSFNETSVIQRSGGRERPLRVREEGDSPLPTAPSRREMGGHLL